MGPLLTYSGRRNERRRKNPQLASSAARHCTFLCVLIGLLRLDTTNAWITRPAPPRATHHRASSDIGDDLASLLGDRSAADWIDAASAVTQESCRLLGIKSMGVDYGLVRTGVAATVGYEPKPLAILKDLTPEKVSATVVRYAAAEQASRIIVGLPLHKNGTMAEQTNLTLSFATTLAIETLRVLGPNVPVVLWDERYTSKEAAARARSRNPHGGRLYGTLDADAACIILEHYYLDNGKDAPVVEVDDDELRAECLREFAERQQAEETVKAASLVERELRIQQRKEAIERDRQIQAEAGVGSGSAKKKKKRKKKK